MRKVLQLASAIGALQPAFGSLSAAHAQEAGPFIPYTLGDAVRSAESARREAPPPRRPDIETPETAEPRFTMRDGATIFIRRITLDGPDLVGVENIRDALERYENRKLTLGQIYEAADKITNLYRAKGYIVAKTYVPEQDARNGQLMLKVIPGRYGAVKVDNNSLVRTDYLQNMIDRALAGAPFIRKDELERAMLLNADLAGAGAPRISIAPGQQPETSDFIFSPPEDRRIEGYLLADNYGSPYTGRIRTSGAVTLNSPTGYGDRLSAFGIVSERGGLVNGRLAYSPPPAYGGLRGEVSVFETVYKLGGVYNNAQAWGEANGVAANLVYPLKRQRDESIYLFSNLTHKYLNDKVLGVSTAYRYIEVGTIGVNHDMFGAFLDLPYVTNTSLSGSFGFVRFPNTEERRANQAGIGTAGSYGRINLSVNGTIAITPLVSASLAFRAQKAIGRNLDSSEKLSLTGYFGVRSFDEGMAGDSGFVTTPEIRYALPTIEGYQHSVGAFSDIGVVWLENPFYTITQKACSPLSDVGAGYYGSYDLPSFDDVSPLRTLFLKAQVAHSVGWNQIAPTYNKYTKGLFQVGVTF